MTICCVCGSERASREFMVKSSVLKGWRDSGCSSWSSSHQARWLMVRRLDRNRAKDMAKAFGHKVTRDGRFHAPGKLRWLATQCPDEQRWAAEYERVTGQLALGLPHVAPQTAAVAAETKAAFAAPANGELSRLQARLERVIAGYQRLQQDSYALNEVRRSLIIERDTLKTQVEGLKAELDRVKGKVAEPAITEAESLKGRFANLIIDN